MNLLLIEIDNQIRDTLISYLLPKGYPIYDCAYNDDVDGIISKKEINVVFIDIDKEGGLAKHVALIKKLRTLGMNVITYTDNTQEDEIKILIELGVTAFVKKTNNLKVDIKKIVEILLTKIHTNDKRQALRIKVVSEDSIKINFSIPNSSHIVNAEVIELSFVGLLFKVDQYSDTRTIKQGDLINRLQLNIGSKRAITSVQIVMLKGDFVGAKFTGHDISLKNLLCKYVYEKMSRF